MPAWLPRAIARLNHLLALEHDWDRDGAMPVSQVAAEWAVRLIGEAAQRGAPEPDVVPDVDGGLQVEWHVRGIDLEIATRSQNRFEVLFEDHQTGEDWEAEAGLYSSTIAGPLSLLASRS